MPSLVLACLHLGNPPQPVYVRGHHAQCNRLQETVHSVGSDPSQSAMIQMVDGRLNRGVLLVRVRKRGGILARTLHLGPVDFLGHDIQGQHLI